MAIHSQVLTIGGRIGLALLLVSALGMAIAAVFVTDPLTASAPTTHGQLHQLGSLPDSIPFGALFISWNLVRRNPAWFPARRLLVGTTGLAQVGNVVFIASLVVVFPRDGNFGPEVLLGWPNRILILTQGIWLMTVAWQAIKLRMLPDHAGPA